MGGKQTTPALARLAGALRRVKFVGFVWLGRIPTDAGLKNASITTVP